MNPSGAHLHHEQDIESAQGDGVEGEKIGGQQTRGQQTRGLSPKEGPPPSVCSTGCRAESGGGQDPPDRASAFAVAEPGEFSLDSAMAIPYQNSLPGVTWCFVASPVIMA
jgi:hypothetical protein